MGCGSMARSLIFAFLRQGVLTKDRIIATHHVADVAAARQEELGVKVICDNRAAVNQSKVIMLCVRPDQLKGLLDEIRPALTKEKTVISIVAGIPLDRLIAALPHKPVVVHVHPTSLAVGKKARGISLYVSPPGTSTRIDRLVRGLFKSVGSVKKVREADLNGYIILVGVGPALITRFVGAISETASNVTRVPEESTVIMKTMLMGVREVLDSDRLKPDQVFERIATKGGVTQAGMNILERGMSPLLKDALAASMERLKELSELPL